jgi:type VI secretion system protein ImpJ
MYLGPHEFQVQARYFEDALHFATAALWHSGCGVMGLALDADALRNGTLNLLHASGIFPDGLPFYVPQADPAPATRPIAHLFPPTRDSLTVFLGLRGYHSGGRNCADSTDSAESRYLAESRQFHDETSGADARAITVRRKNIRFLLEPELTPDTVCLPVARLKRDGAGQFVYDPDFVPPCLQISASERLMLTVQRLIEILEAKSASLSHSGGAGEFSSRDLANFWLKHAVNSGLAALRHLRISKRGHPQEVFLEMSRLGGALCTFALDSHPRTLPHYDHLHPEECFGALDLHIRSHLETIIPTNCVTIPLARVANYFYEGEITDTRVLARARWILGVRAAMGEAELIARAPQIVKVCSAKFVGELVRRAMAGLVLTHLPVPPPAVPAKVEMQYFGVSRDGPFWEHIVQTHRVGIYVPGDLPDAELELAVLLDK